MATSVEQVKDILASIIHPEKEKNIIELGLVKTVTVEDNIIKVILEFERVNDPLKSSLKRACEDILKQKISADAKIEVQVQTKMQVGHSKPKPPPVLPDVKNIIAVASGKGGVGKSTIATNMAAAFAKTGAKVGLIDADIYGPSIPKMMGVEDEKPMIGVIDGRELIIPVEKYGIKMLSIGFFVGSNDATVWRGPMASNAFTQLIRDAHWGELDYLFIDLPPGTSDIHLSLVQTVSVSGAVIVSTPQNVALADVVKGISMFNNQNINVPVLGIVENMSWFTPEELPDNKYYIFGKDGCRELANTVGVPLLGQIPIVQSICEKGDKGTPSVLEKDTVSEAFKGVAENLRQQLIKRNANLAPTKKVEITK